MLTLGIETSCDETAAAVTRDGRTVLSNVISSQIKYHKKYGGVVPEIASRKHLQSINFIIDQALKSARCRIKDIDNIAVTTGPGLVGALLIGISTAKSIAYSNRISLVGVNHLEGHIFSNFLGRAELKPPFLALIVSGGHSDLVYMSDYGSYQVLGRTRDDAVGEAYDKVAKIYGLGYPGGPVIDKLAKKGNPELVAFPRVKMKNESLDFSFSGIKTAVVNYMRNNKSGGRSRIKVSDILASFQSAIVDMLLKNTMKAAKMKKAGAIVIGGGVAANSYLRSSFSRAFSDRGIRIYYPEPIFCTDNAAMIACVGYYKAAKKKGVKTSGPIEARANMKIS